MQPPTPSLSQNMKKVDDADVVVDAVGENVDRKLHVHDDADPALLAHTGVPPDKMSPHIGHGRPTGKAPHSTLVVGCTGHFLRHPLFAS
jgi:hypothetical protein